MKTRTGVGHYIASAHFDERMGTLHGHTWEITAWHEGTDADARDLQRHLVGLCLALDHRILEPKVATGEALAARILNGSGETCVEVEVRRPLERIYAKAIRT